MALRVRSWVKDFNPRSPRGGATQNGARGSIRRQRFQSTLPTRGSDRLYDIAPEIDAVISIHAPHEGERLVVHIKRGFADVFQSTLPTRGSDDEQGGLTMYILISIHAPHEGERLFCPSKYAIAPKFQSTLPTRGSDYSGWCIMVA